MGLGLYSVCSVVQEVMEHQKDPDKIRDYLKCCEIQRKVCSVIL